MQRHIEYSEREEEKRWKKYAKANDRFPDVRKAELGRQMFYLNPQQGETIVEVGTGNGILTFPMANAVGKNGKVYSFDYRKENLYIALCKNTQALPIIFAPQINNPQTGRYDFPFENNSVDKVSTIAAFHHYDDRSCNTGLTGRKKALQEFYRILKFGGKLIIGDIADDTVNQRYFDEEMDNPNSPAYCWPRGHPHDFLNKDIALRLCGETGFKNIEFRVERTPLVFDSKREAGEFFHMIHNAKGSPSESLQIAKKRLGLEKIKNKYKVGWYLFYLTAEK